MARKPGGSNSYVPQGTSPGSNRISTPTLRTSVPREGLEPPTFRLKGGCSAIELARRGGLGNRTQLLIHTKDECALHDHRGTPETRTQRGSITKATCTLYAYRSQWRARTSDTWLTAKHVTTTPTASGALRFELRVGLVPYPYLVLKIA